jgi:hypothetical protein
MYLSKQIQNFVTKSFQICKYVSVSLYGEMVKLVLRLRQIKTVGSSTL